MPRILDFLSPWGLCDLLQWLGEPTSLLNSTQKPQEVLLREEKSLTVTGYKVCPEDIPIPLLPGGPLAVMEKPSARGQHREYESKEGKQTNKNPDFKTEETLSPVY